MTNDLKEQRQVNQFQLFFHIVRNSSEFITPPKKTHILNLPILWSFGSDVFSKNV